MDFIQYSLTRSVLELIKEMLYYFIEEDASDVKTFTQVLYVFGNMLAVDSSIDTNRMLLKYIADNSSILESTHALISQSTELESEVRSLICKVVS